MTKMEGFISLGYQQARKFAVLTGFLHLCSYSNRPAPVAFQKPQKSFAVAILALKGQKRGDLIVLNTPRERKWPDSSVKEYQRKDETLIKLKSI